MSILYKTKKTGLNVQVDQLEDDCYQVSTLDLSLVKYFDKKEIDNKFILVGNKISQQIPKWVSISENKIRNEKLKKQL